MKLFSKTFLTFAVVNAFFLPVFCLDKKVVFVAGPKSHGFFAHEHAAGCKLLAEHLKEAGIGIEPVVVAEGGYPKDAVYLMMQPQSWLHVMGVFGICSTSISGNLTRSCEEVSG